MFFLCFKFNRNADITILLTMAEKQRRAEKFKTAVIYEVLYYLTSIIKE